MGIDDVFNSHLILNLPVISKITCDFDTDPPSITVRKCLDYILAFFNEFTCLILKKHRLQLKKKEEEPAPLIAEAKLDEIIQPDTEEIDPDAEVSIHATMEKAIENYRKIKEGKEELTEKELEILEKACEAIRQRDIIDVDTKHDAMELSADGKILMGPPTLTRFEKARIYGSKIITIIIRSTTIHRYTGKCP